MGKIVEKGRWRRENSRRKGKSLKGISGIV
jgi:hypothetical protein